MDQLFYTDSDNLLRIACTVPIVYLMAIFYIRIAGKRATSQMNNFDWIVTVAMGTIVATTIALKNVSIADGALSIGLLLALQYILTKQVHRHKWLRMIIKSSPQLLLYKGEFLEDNMHRERMVEAEVNAAIRHNGLKSIKQVYAVVLETDASLSIIPISEDNDTVGFSLSDVDGLPDGLRDDLDSHDEEDNDEASEGNTQAADKDSTNETDDKPG